MTSVGNVWGETDCNYFSVKTKLQSVLQYLCGCCLGPHLISSKQYSFLTFHYLSKAGDVAKTSWLRFNFRLRGKAEVVLDGKGN